MCNAVRVMWYHIGCKHKFLWHDMEIEKLAGILEFNSA